MLPSQTSVGLPLLYRGTRLVVKLNSMTPLIYMLRTRLTGFQTPATCVQTLAGSNVAIWLALPPT